MMRSITSMQGAAVALCLGAAALAEQAPRGLVEPFHDVLLGPPVPGRIAAIHHREGARVDEDAVLFELDARIEEMEVRRRALIYQDRAELAAARARKELIGEDLASTRALFERTGSVSREELRRKELEAVLAGLDLQRLEQAKLREEVEYQMAREHGELRRIRAPFAGVVADAILDVGESVQAHQPVMRLVDDRRCYLVVNLPAERADRVTVGDPARMRFDGRAPRFKQGRVAFLAPTVDPASGLRTVKLEFDNIEAPVIEPGVSGAWLEDAGAKRE